MKYLTDLTRLMLWCLLLSAGAAQAREFNPSETEGEGEIQGLDFGTYEALIGGYDYTVSENVRVEINGSYGAFTMLEEGMLVKFNFLQFSDGTREIIDMQEVDELEGF